MSGSQDSPSPKRRLRSGTEYEPVESPKKRRKSSGEQTPARIPAYECNLPRELWYHVAKHALQSVYDTQQVLEFPQLQKFPCALTTTSGILRRQALLALGREILFVSIQFWICDKCCPPGHSDQKRSLLERHVQTINAFPPSFFYRYKDSTSFSTVHITLSCSSCRVRRRSSRDQKYASAIFPYNKLQVLLLCSLIQKEIYMYSDIEIHQNVHSKLTKQMFDRLLHLMASLVKNAPVNTSIRISSSGDQPSRYTGLELRQRRQLAGTSDILAYYHSQIIAALQGGQPPYHVFPIIFDIFDTHYISLKQWSNTYDKDNATQRRLLALNGNYVALLMSGLAQYLLLQPNTRDRQRHYTLTDVNTARVMVLQRRPGIWRNLLQALDSRVEPRVNPQPDSDTEDGATQEQRLDPALWCSIKQASVELRLAFARAAFVVGDSESMLKENHGQDRDPIADIRETSMLRGGARQDRLEAATKHIHNAWVDRGEVRSYVDQLRTAEERSLVLRWLKRYDPMFGKVQAVVNELAGNQARKIRHEGEWSRRRMSTRMPKPKSTTTTARIRPAMLDASKKEDLELLINVRHRETFGDSSWYYY